MLKKMSLILLLVSNVAVAHAADPDASASSSCGDGVVDSSCLSGTNINYHLNAVSTPTNSSPSTPTVTPSSGGSTEPSDALTWNDGATSGSSESVASGTAGQSYSASLVGATSSLGLTVSYSISGSLPSGLSLSSGPAITGTPGSSGTTNFSIVANDGRNQITRTVSLDIDAADYLYWETTEYENYATPFTPVGSDKGFVPNGSVPSGLIGLLVPLMGEWDINGSDAPNRLRAISSSGRPITYYIQPLTSDVISAWRATHMDGSYSYFTGELGVQTTAAHFAGTSINNKYNGYQVIGLDGLVGTYGTTCSHETQTLTAVMATDGIATTAVPEYLAVSFATNNCNPSPIGRGGGLIR